MIKENGFCSPERIDLYRKHKSCLSLKELKFIVNEYNRHNKNDKIVLKTSNPAEIIRKIEHKFKCIENNYYQCLTNNGLLNTKNDMMQPLINRFRPSNKLLFNSPINTVQLTEVLEQYEKKYKSFSYLGTFPLDFNEINSSRKSCVIYKTDICYFTLKDLKETRKKQFAITINFDKHDLPGSHWVCLYGNINKCDPRFGLWYFDSYGTDPPANMLEFIKKLQIEMNLPYYANHRQYQYKSSECGIFCILFIVMCLENRKNVFKVVCEKFQNPSSVEKEISIYRSKIFNIIP